MKTELNFDADISVRHNNTHLGYVHLTITIAQEFISATKSDKTAPVPIKYLPHGKPAQEPAAAASSASVEAPSPSASAPTAAAPDAATEAPAAAETKPATPPVEAPVQVATEAAPFAAPESSEAEKIF